MKFAWVCIPGFGCKPTLVGESPRLLAHGVKVTHIQMKSMIEIIAMISSTQLSAERSVLFIIGSV